MIPLSVVLGTRLADIDVTGGLQMAVGVWAGLEAEFVCEVVNFPERGDSSGVSRETVRITTNIREY